MCGRMHAMWPMSELMDWPPSETNPALSETEPASPADVLIEHLGVAKRTTAEVRDMYSRPIAGPVVMIVPNEVGPKRQHPKPATEPDRDAA